MTKTPEVPEIELRGLSKAFGACRANEHIDLCVRRGTIHAIIGENGAGKSTAMKMLYGVYSPDTGDIVVRGERKRWKNPAQAIACGIGMVHQHFMLAGPYTALENILLGVESATLRGQLPGVPSWLFPVDREKAKRKLDALCDQYGLQRLNWDTPVEELPVGLQQRLEILKLLYQNAQILILDEPTAVLTPQEIQDLFVNLKKMARDGKTILIITHKLKEVMTLADEVTVFRAGRVVGHRQIAETNPNDLADLMVGRKVLLQVEIPPPPELGAPALEVKNLKLQKIAGQLLVNFTVHSGEVVGIAGVEGNGQSDLLQVLLHAAEYRSRLTGELKILSQTAFGAGRVMSAHQIKSLGVGIIPEDRHHEGLLMERPLDENFLLGQQRIAPFSQHGILNGKALEDRATQAFDEYDVRPRALAGIAKGLSGGNQQKLIIAREFERKPRLLIAAQPTRGVDVGAIEFIHNRILRARTEGAGVLLVSSELDEILTLSDRILVMYRGEIVAEFKRGEATEQQLGLCMGGAKQT